MTDKNANDSIYRKLNNIYLEIRTPMIFVSTGVGFSVGILVGHVYMIRNKFFM